MRGEHGNGLAADGALALVCGVLRLDVHGMFELVLAQALWTVVIAVLMMRRSI